MCIFIANVITNKINLAITFVKMINSLVFTEQMRKSS